MTSGSRELAHLHTSFAHHLRCIPPALQMAQVHRDRARSGINALFDDVAAFIAQLQLHCTGRILRAGDHQLRRWNEPVRVVPVVRDGRWPRIIVAPDVLAVCACGSSRATSWAVAAAALIRKSVASMVLVVIVPRFIVRCLGSVAQSERIHVPAVRCAGHPSATCRDFRCRSRRGELRPMAKVVPCDHPGHGPRSPHRVHVCVTGRANWGAGRRPQLQPAGDRRHEGQRQQNAQYVEQHVRVRDAPGHVRTG